jgi:CHAT domain-containing protein
MPTILDFQIRPRENGDYILQILQRSNSQLLAEASFDYDLSYMTEFEIKRLEFDAKDPYGRLERLKAFGTKLYRKLFTPNVHKLWQNYKDKSDFLVLCLRLAPEASKLEALPWETLFDGEEFLAAGAKTGLSRLPLDISIQNELPSLPPPFKMLAFMSSPLDLQDENRLQLEREQEILLQAVNAPAGQGKLQVDFEDEAKLPILENSLESSYQIFHYSGHGISPENGGGLLLEDSQGKKRPTSVTEFLQAFQKGEKDLRLAVISGCQTARTFHAAGFRDLARGLARRKIPAVIAMQFSISDSAGLLLKSSVWK